MSQTIGEVRKLIKSAKAVYVRPFLGVFEGWVKISKAEAIGMFAAYSDNKTMIDAFDFDHTLTIEENGGLFIS